VTRRGAWRIWFLAGALLTALVPFSLPAAVGTSEPTCVVRYKTVTCAKTADGAKVVMRTAPSLALEYRLSKMCPTGSVYAREGCLSDEGPGDWYVIETRPIDSTSGWDLRGQFCLPFRRNTEFGIVGPGEVWREVKKLQWPAATLDIEPPGGRTLANLETNFFTQDASRHRITVQLLGQTVDVEVHPVAYVWHAGDGTSWETDDPGSPYPALDVTHVYESAGIVTPSVDLVYSGRYRLDGAWHVFPDNHVVPGESIELRVVEARPELVAPGSRP
jgi:hypothetical protein